MAIRNRLAYLMGERGIKATKVSADTGIARSTLTALVNNRSKMIALETIDTLCQYLRITPADFFVYDSDPTDPHWYYSTYRKR